MEEVSTAHSIPASAEEEVKPDSETHTQIPVIGDKPRIEPGFSEYQEVKGVTFVQEQLNTLRDLPGAKLLDEYIHDRISQSDMPDTLDSARILMAEVASQLQLPKITLNNLGLVSRYLRTLILQETINQRRERIFNAVRRTRSDRRSRFGELES